MDTANASSTSHGTPTNSKRPLWCLTLQVRHKEKARSLGGRARRRVGVGAVGRSNMRDDPIEVRTRL